MCSKAIGVSYGKNQCRYYGLKARKLTNELIKQFNQIDTKTRDKIIT